MKLDWAAVALCAGAVSVQAQTTERVNLSSLGLQADEEAMPMFSVSSDARYVVFSSYATNLVTGDTAGWADVFLRDRLAGTTERLSVDPLGGEADHDSFYTSISDDGRFVAFTSRASNLVPGDTNAAWDVFVRDLQLGTTTRVSVDSAGVEGNNNSPFTTISADGRFVAFHSFASNLVAGDTNLVLDCFVHDLQTGTTERVSVNSSAGQANGPCREPRISADGRFVVFGSDATNLVAGDTNGFTDLFVRDRLLGTTERVSVSTAGAQGNAQTGGWGNSTGSRPISADGRFVTFCSQASNLVGSDTNAVPDCFVRDRAHGTTELVSVDSSGLQGAGMSVGPSLTPDGRFVTFQSEAPDLVAGDTNGYRDIFVRDRLAGSTERVSLSWTGAQAGNVSDMPSLTPDGRFVLFGSTAASLVLGDTGGHYDVFLRDRGAPNVVSFCIPDQAGAPGCPCANPPVGAGRGCDNSSATGGAALSASGSASLAADTLVFGTTAEKPTSTSTVVQGTSALFDGVVFGQGLRCVGGALKRLYVKTAAGGSIQAPGGGDLSVSARSAALGDPIVAGQHRYYMVQYRDPIVLGGCPSASTFNATNALAVPWSP